ncbi:hypothetical protein D8I24_8118 [Cupriavidus necator H850]|nr:hypothetical protein D8I24_8118 [Cupriavidus necator H850]
MPGTTRAAQQGQEAYRRGHRAPSAPLPCAFFPSARRAPVVFTSSTASRT